LKNRKEKKMILKKKYSTVKIPARTLPVVAEGDVIVVGGGTAGFIAAIAAARTGVRTILVEKEGYLGGALTGTYCTEPSSFGDSEGCQIIKGIGWEVMERMERVGAAILDRIQWKAQTFPETIKTVALEMVIEAGVELYLHSWASELLIENGLLKGIVIQSKSGSQAIMGKVFIDATSDADLTFLAGAPTEKLEPEELWQTSVDLTVCNVNVKKLIKWANENDDEILTLEIPEIEEDYSGIHPMFGFVIPGDDTEILPGKAGIKHKGPMPTVKLLIHLDISRIQGSVEIDGTDVKSLTYAEVEGRRRAMDHLSYLKEHVPGFEDACVISASHLGVRESRRIIGDYKLTINDLLKNARFPDVVALNCRSLDRHLKGDVFELALLVGNHDVPLRALIPQKVENLLVAGRCISSDHESNASLRGAATCMATGHAAGTAAAIAAKENCKVRDLDIKLIQKVLKEQQAILCAK
jgi:hypothetical protein